MRIQRLMGIVLLVGGIGFFIVGFHAADSVVDRVSNFFTGHFTDETVWYMTGGIIAFLVGLSMISSSPPDPPT